MKKSYLQTWLGVKERELVDLGLINVRGFIKEIEDLVYLERSRSFTHGVLTGAGVSLAAFIFANWLW